MATSINPSAETIGRAEERRTMCRADYLAHVSDSTHAEWVNGEVTTFMPPTAHHQDIVAFLLGLIRLYAKVRGAGKALAAPFEMRLFNGISYREPDILFVASENLDRLSNERLNGPADLVVEVVSNESVRRDRQDKFIEYASGEVPEYWIIDPRFDPPTVQAYQLKEATWYDAISRDADGRLNSTVLPGFQFDPAWLTQDPLPEPSELMDSIVGETEADVPANNGQSD